MTRCGTKLGAHVHAGTNAKPEFVIMIGDTTAVYISRACLEKLTVKNLKTLASVPLVVSDERVLTNE